MNIAEQIDVAKKDTVSASYSISNNDSGTKDIAYLFKDQKGVVFDGGGARLVFHGRILPFVVDNCSDIVLKNFSIEYDRPFYSQAETLLCRENILDLKFGKEFPFYTRDGNLIFTAPEWESDALDCVSLMQEYDRETKCVLYNGPVVLTKIGKKAEQDPTAPGELILFEAEELKGDGCVRLRARREVPFTTGSAMLIAHEKRDNPAIFINGSKNIRLENIKILHSGSMGVSAQTSGDISLEKITVAAPENSAGLVSTNCDATHFSGCRGKIDIRDCVFESMLDDAVNVHGIYACAESYDGNRLRVRLKHFQHAGVMFYKPGDRLAVLKNKTAERRSVFTVKECGFDENSLIWITTEESADIRPGDHIDNLSANPDVFITRVRAGKNRPRGFLVTSSGRVEISDCQLNNSEHGIFIGGDLRFWYESGQVSDVYIHHNRFTDCNHGWRDHSIDISPAFAYSAAAPFFHKNIRIEDNVFETFTGGAVSAESVDGLTLLRNTIVGTKTYQNLWQ